MDDRCVVVGGLHRVRAYERAGRLEIPCVIEPMTRANRRLIGTAYGSFLMVEERTMPRAYSGDLRRRVVAAALEGGQSREVVARRFTVGRSSVYRWVETAQTEGRLEARPMRGGPRPMIRDETEAALKDMVKSDNHLTLAEYRDRLADRTEIRVHPWTVGRALRRLGLTRKKLEWQSWLVVDLATRCLKGIGDGQECAAPAAGS